ncbi:hypothetical protein ANCCAN_08607 [Ancylostoma caninum]|uniref:Reverse transcriptase RNase H-like domain-containing protein n=1 Tax=Ancylostoma caninum TaxID=29170 RepID=A0A368GLX0_ANCCA|nr:hypothetical protein ANCCAN_08607 [Ancylostoma caninum]
MMALYTQCFSHLFIDRVFFASKCLTRAERIYHITDQEALAMVYALKKFHYFICGVRIIVRTDHAALTSFFKRINDSPSVLRWAVEVQRYNLTIEHVKGAANFVADALSRGFPQNACPAQGYAENEKVVCALQENEWLAELRRDPYFLTVISAIENKRDAELRLPRRDKILSTPDFIIEGGKLKLIREEGNRLLSQPVYHGTQASVVIAGNATFVCPPRSHHSPYHLPLLFAKAVDFANRNPWTAASWTLLKPRKTLQLLPEGFDETLRCFESELMVPKVMRSPEDVKPEWFEDDLSAIVVFSNASCSSALG